MLVLALVVSLSPLAGLKGPRYNFSRVARPFQGRESLAPQETVADIRVHGNVATPDQEIVELAGIRVGAAVGPTTIADLASRLRATKRFQRVDVLKRFASIADPTQVVIVIIVDEGPVKIELTGNAGSPTHVVRTHGPHMMFLPVLSSEDGYGLTYGAQFALPDAVGKDSRVAFPLTWGGDKRAAIEFEKAFDRGPVSRVLAGTSISRRTHPFFERDDDRGRVWTRAEREIAHSLRAGATGGWQHVSFLDTGDSFTHLGGDVVLDTRLDPMLARNAVYARAAWTHFALRNGDALNGSELEGRGYVGLFGQSVLVVRALRDDADKPRPVYLQPMLGGLANLRGFKAGTAVGDTLVAGSVEVRLPLTSPLRIGKIGVNVFVDAGTVYSKSERLANQTLKRGVGAGLWFSAAFVRMNLAVAHGLGATTRVHFGGTLSF
jgi:outer membrane protein assembly factor BamA